MPTAPTTDQIAAAVEMVLNDDWYWYPVRHHSATVAQHLQAVMRERNPKLILIEGPSEASDLIPHLANRETKPPVAIYTSFEDVDNTMKLAGITTPAEETPPRWAAWYPFVEYSPELVAIREAKKLKAEVQFIDLPHYGRLPAEAKWIIEAVNSKQRGEAEQDAEPAEDDELEPSKFDKDEERGWQSEHLIEESNFYQSLAVAGGYRSWDEGWDSIFEFNAANDTETFRKELLAFCAAVRATTPAARMEADGTLDRERYMMQRIRKATKAARVDPSDVMIVCGGLHCFLNRSDETPPPKVPTGRIYNTIVPYSYFRISDMSGYRAGNRAPRFYELFWQHRLGKLENPSADFVVRVLRSARKFGDKLSSADAISVAQHARMLSALRGRTTPIFDDIRDALFTCCCKGDPKEQGRRLQRAIDEEAIGNRIGKVAGGVPRLPIVADFYEQLEKLGLEGLATKEHREKHKLDKRKPEDFSCSSFFHRVHFVGIPFCDQIGREETEFESGLIFQERWATQWSPNVEAKLIERNLLGDSIEAAAINQARQFIVEHQGQAGAICSMLVRATQMDFADLMGEVYDLASQAIDEDGRFISLTQAVSQLEVLDRHALHHDLKRAEIRDMASRAFSRACFAMLDIVSAPDDDLPAILQGLLALAEVVLKSDDMDQRQLFEQYITTTLAETNLPLLRGALMGLTVEMKLQSYEVLTNEIQGFAQSSQEKTIDAGDFIKGVITVSRVAISMGATELIDAMDNLLRAAEWDVFTTMLPKLRSAMEGLHARHRNSLAKQVAIKYGLSEEDVLLDRLQVSVAEAHGIADVDRRVAEIMSRWSFAE